jgi:3-oxoacyl-[acyl-carrier-protein] synthase II
MDITQHPPRRRVVVTGLGTLNPLGQDVATTWDALLAGRSGIGRITHFDPTDYKTQIAGEVTGFDPVAHFGAKDARRMARPTQLGLAAAAQALAQAGLDETSSTARRRWSRVARTGSAPSSYP